VSEFAARCPECHAGTDEAEELPLDPMPREEPALGRRLPPPPGQTPEGTPDHPDTGIAPPARHRRRLAAMAAAAVVLAVVTASVVASTQGSGRGNAPSAAQTLAQLKLTGRVVSDINGTIVLSNPDGTRQVVTTPLSPLGPGGTTDLSSALDARYLATPRGDVISAQGLRVDHTTVATEFPTGYAAQPDPFALGDHALVILNNGTQSPVSDEVSVVSLIDGHTVTLGRADYAAGDPRTLGAFVSIPQIPQPAGAPLAEGGNVDARVELLRAGSPPTVLATTGQLDTDTGQHRSQPATLTAFPDRAGDKVAIEVNPVDVGNSDAGLVVVDRTGRVLAAVPPSQGPVQNSTPAWSPDGESLAYYMFGPRGAEIGVWHVAGPVHARPAPDPGDSFLTCLWSPDGSDILCPASQGPTDESSLWLLGAARGGPLVQVPAPGLPEVWLPGSS
jgi:hypothetical protein